MNLLSLLSYGNFVLFLLLSIYSVKFSPIESKLNKYSVLVCLSLGMWNFCYTFFYIAPDKSSAWMWYKLASIGITAFPAFTLYFFLILTKRDKFFKHKYQYIAFYLIPSFLVVTNLLNNTTALAQNIVQSSIGLGWTYVNSGTSIFYWIALFYLYLYFYITFLCLYKWYKESNYLREKNQAKIFIIVDAVVLLLGSVTDLIHPLINNAIPPMANLFTSLFIFCYWYIIRRYNVFDVNYIASPELILDTIMDPVMVIDESYKIINTNSAVKDTLGYSSEYLKDKNLIDILADDKYCTNNDLAKLFKNKEINNKEINIINSKGEIINSLLSSSVAEDNVDGFLGIVIAFKDITAIKAAENKLKSINYKYKQAADDLYKIANFDSLTGIPNRRMFFDTIKTNIIKYEQSNEDFTLIFMDLDDFKTVNDKYGHDIGDKLLIETVHRLQSCINKDDTLARVGGDEFVLIISKIISEDPIHERIHMIKNLFIDPININNHLCKIGISAGFSIYSKSNKNINDLIKIADKKMYKDKEKIKI